MKYGIKKKKKKKKKNCMAFFLLGLLDACSQK